MVTHMPELELSAQVVSGGVFPRAGSEVSGRELQQKAAGVCPYIPSQRAANFAGLPASGGLSLSTSHAACSNSSSFQCATH